MSYGAKGYLLKDSQPQNIAVAIRSIHRGYTHLGPGLFNKALNYRQEQSLSDSFPPELDELSPKEKEVLSLIATGANNREIAQSLYISEKLSKIKLLVFSASSIYAIALRQIS